MRQGLDDRSTNTDGHLMERRTVLGRVPAFPRRIGPWESPRGRANRAGTTSIRVHIGEGDDLFGSSLRTLTKDQALREAAPGGGRRSAKRLPDHYGHFWALPARLAPASAGR